MTNRDIDGKACCRQPRLIKAKDSIIEKTTKDREIVVWSKVCSNCKRVTKGATLLTRK